MNDATHQESVTREPVIPVRRALISVSDKTGLAPFARELTTRGVALVSTGGSARGIDGKKAWR